MADRANEAIKAKRLVLPMSARLYTMIASLPQDIHTVGFLQALNFHIITHNLPASPHHPVIL